LRLDIADQCTAVYDGLLGLKYFGGIAERVVDSVGAALFDYSRFPAKSTLQTFRNRLRRAYVRGATLP